MSLFKGIGNAFQGINSIAEGVRKRRDGKKFIAMSEAVTRNAEQQDFINNAAQVKVSGEGTRQNLENINLNASQAFSQAADAGIRGVGMIGKIQQNVNQASQVETQRLADREFAVQQAKAAENSQIQAEKQRIFENKQNKADQQLERGQALRSQGSAEIGQGASATGGAIDSSIEKLAPIAGALIGGPAGAAVGSALTKGGQAATGGPPLVNPLDQSGRNQVPIPSLANTQFQPQGFGNFNFFQ